jgi:hypothetical protein
VSTTTFKNSNFARRAQESYCSGRLLEPQGALLQFAGGHFRVSTEVDRGSRLVALMPTLTAGWVKIDIHDQMIEQHLGLIDSDYEDPKRESLGDTDPNFWPSEHDPWQRLVHLTLKSMETGDLITFVATCEAETNAIMDLCLVYDEHLRRFPDLMPIVEPGINGRGEPVFRVVGWAMQRIKQITEQINEY